MIDTRATDTIVTVVAIAVEIEAVTAIRTEDIETEAGTK